jgi:hypothetical protein
MVFLWNFLLHTAGVRDHLAAPRLATCRPDAQLGGMKKTFLVALLV